MRQMCGMVVSLSPKLWNRGGEMERYTIAKLSKLYQSGEVSPVEILETYQNRLLKYDEQLNTGISPIETAMENAKAAEEAYRAGTANVLTGMPLAIKDNICTKNARTTCASRMLEEFRPPYSATAVEHLETAGAVPFYKTNMDEFAMGGSGETSYFGATKNPYDNTCVAGGSSSGSAASVAAGLSVAALGSDTGGSIRQPAAFCGVTGIKPTYGSVSRYGLVAFASSLDQIGPIANNSLDCGLLLNALMGYDGHDGTSWKREYADVTSKIGQSVKGMKFAVIRQLMGKGIDPEVCEAVKKTIAGLEAEGAIVEEVELEGLDHAIAAYYLISSAEASSNLARYDGVKYGYRTENYGNIEELYRNTRKEGFGEEVKRRILLGTYALCSGYYDDYYKKAVYIKEKLKENYAKIFEKYDAILSPTAPSTAYKLGGQVEDPIQMYTADICTVTVNLAGLPAASTPCGYGEGGLPIGISVIGRPFDEATVLQVTADIESRFVREEPKNLEVGSC